jgi:hypothetical protein
MAPAACQRPSHFDFLAERHSAVRFHDRAQDLANDTTPAAASVFLAQGRRALSLSAAARLRVSVKDGSSPKRWR